MAVPPQVNLCVKVPDLVSNTIILMTPSGKATVNIYLHDDVKFHKIYSSYTTPLYKKLGLFSLAVGEITSWAWWSLARRRPWLTWKCRMLLRLMVGEHRLQDNVVSSGCVPVV